MSASKGLSAALASFAVTGLPGVKNARGRVARTRAKARRGKRFDLIRKEAMIRYASFFLQRLQITDAPVEPFTRYQGTTTKERRASDSAKRSLLLGCASRPFLNDLYLAKFGARAGIAFDVRQLIHSEPENARHRVVHRLVGGLKP